jgi:hypothetical protein
MHNEKGAPCWGRSSLYFFVVCVELDAIHRRPEVPSEVVRRNNDPIMIGESSRRIAIDPVREEFSLGGIVSKVDAGEPLMITIEYDRYLKPNILNISHHDYWPFWSFQWN